ncbi:MAG: hypothetical protein BGP09_31460 [Rhizobium sp. 60-20]|nr:MAG: hypothetical protein BGP09_31460 [Rhizobium sp. 60-20]
MHPAITDTKMAAHIAIGEVEAAAEYLAQLMARLHGGNWRRQIDHNLGFVLVAEKPDNRPITPKRERA